MASIGIMTGNARKTDSCAPMVTITAPDGRVKTLLPSRREQLRILRLIVGALVIQLVLCLLMIASESATLTLLRQSIRTCRIGSGVWAGVIGLICSGMGICLMLERMACFGPTVGRNELLKFAYAVSAVFSVLMDAVLIVTVSICICGLQRAWNDFKLSKRKDKSNSDWSSTALNTATALNSCLVSITALHLILTVVSVKILWQGWLDENYRVNVNEKPVNKENVDNQENSPR